MTIDRRCTLDRDHVNAYAYIWLKDFSVTCRVLYMGVAWRAMGCHACALQPIAAHVGVFHNLKRRLMNLITARNAKPRGEDSNEF